MFSWENIKNLTDGLVQAQADADRFLSRTPLNPHINYWIYEEALLQSQSVEGYKYLILTRKIDPQYHRFGFNALSFVANTPSPYATDQEEKIQLLLQYRVNLNSQATDLHDRTPLHLFIVNQNPGGAIFCIYEALKQKILINFEIKDRSGDTPLLLATKTVQQDIALCILEQKKKHSKNIDINTQDSTGKTPLDYAFIFGQHELIDYLTSLEAETNVIKDCVSLEKYDKHAIRQMLELVGVNPDYKEGFDPEKNIHSKTRAEKFLDKQLWCKEIFKLPKTNTEHSTQQSTLGFKK